MKTLLPLQAVLFDLDGTLVDTAPDFHRVLNDLRTEYGLAELSFDCVRKQVSNGARALIELGFGTPKNNPNFDLHLEQLLARYEANLAIASTLFNGLDPALEQLEQLGIPWGVVTNKPSRFTLPLLAALNLDQRCAVTVCPDQVRHRKPHPESILLACQQLGVEPAHAIYVGDHRRDIEAGNSAGAWTVAAGWGYLDPDEPPCQWQADTLSGDTAEFMAWLLMLTQTEPTGHSDARA